MIQSVYPPCTGKASATGKHPYMCHICHSELTYLKGKLRKRQEAKLEIGQRTFAPGMRVGYLKKAELKEKVEEKERAHKELMLAHRSVRLHRTKDAWIEELQQACSSDDQVKFLTDCLDLFREKDASKFPIQVAVMQNLVGQLRQGRNHHYCDMIKNVAKMCKNWLGGTNYGIIQVSKISLFVKHDMTFLF